MVRWFRIFGDQYVGFWVLGLVLFALQEIPYMIMPLFRLENNPIMHMQESSVTLDFFEKMLGSLCIAFMTFLVQEEVPFFRVGSGVCRIGFFLAMIVLLLNFAGWGLYFSGCQSAGIMLFFIVLMPPLYYVLIGLWRENWVLLITGILFAVVHFSHVYGNLKRQ